MICSNLNLDKVVKTTSRTKGAYKNFFIKYLGDNNKKVQLELMLPACKVPYLPKDTCNRNGEVFMRELNLVLDKDDPHALCFKNYLRLLNEKIGELIGIKLKDPVFDNELVNGSLFGVKLKTKFGEDTFNALYFDKDKNLDEDKDLQEETFQHHTISGVVKLERIWTKADKSSGGMEWTLTEIRDYGDYGAYNQEE